MTKNKTLNQALFCSAIIHQPHALKAFLAAENLSQSIVLTDDIWVQTSKLVSDGSVQVSGLLSDLVEVPKLSDIRIRRTLERGIYPLAYNALLQWHDDKGFNNIFNNYLKISASHQEYLSHNVTILLAFNALYPRLNELQRKPFIERVTEFITSTFGSKSADLVLNHKRFTFKDLFDVSIQQPGFFGHNLITLAWIMRSHSMIEKKLLIALNYNLYVQSTSSLEDPDDGVDIEIFNKSVGFESKEYFVKKINSLIFDTRSNLHQITLADALGYLWEQFPEDRESISRLADYYRRTLEK
ncbi:hypothetical protein [Celerinatantimonas yamalensis]|uniref:Uncharacterized protein n=1 Tax=Celerinatantimonas yamalensis TaxID=559956 RepID=A0ABW9G351_9GAMM